MTKNTMDPNPPAGIALDSQGIPHRLFIHEKPVSSFEQAAADRNQRPEQIVRSILFQVRQGEYVLVLKAGPDQVDWRKLRQIVKRSRVRMATEEEVYEITGFRIGTVSPFGMKNQVNSESEPRIRILIDESVLQEDEVSIGSGVRGTAIIMKSADLHHALEGAEIASLAEDSDM